MLRLVISSRRPNKCRRKHLITIFVIVLILVQYCYYYLLVLRGSMFTQMVRAKAVVPDTAGIVKSKMT